MGSHIPTPPGWSEGAIALDVAGEDLAGGLRGLSRRGGGDERDAPGSLPCGASAWHRHYEDDDQLGEARPGGASKRLIAQSTQSGKDIWDETQVKDTPPSEGRRASRHLLAGRP